MLLLESLSIFTRSPPPLPVRSAAYLDVARTPPPATLRRSSLRPAPHACACCTSCAVCLPPLTPSACTQVPVGPWRVFPSRVPLSLCIPASSSLSYPLNLDIFRFLCPCRVTFREKARGQGASTPQKSWEPGPISPLLGHAGAVQATPPPPPLTPQHV